MQVVVISGIDDAEQARGLLKLGVFAYLTKPFRLEDVEAAVGRALEVRASGQTGEGI